MVFSARFEGFSGYLKARSRLNMELSRCLWSCEVSDPIMFGHCVKAYFSEVFEKHLETFERLGVNANNGLGDLYKKIAELPEAERKAGIGEKALGRLDF